MFIVFDLDGTLALNDHRLHHIRGEVRDYDAFYAACARDQPSPAAIAALRAHYEAGHRLEIWSGRSDQVRTVTEAWLGNHGVNPVLLKRMRPVGDHQPDVELKRGWLREARKNGGAPNLVYDDRDAVVAMWREMGVTCFQVAPGGF